jgi:ferredoxin
MITVKKPLDDIISTVSEKVGGENKSFEGILKNSDITEKYIYIVPDDCIRCNLCYIECPVDAITKPTVRKPAEIIPDKCIKCEICAMTCPVDTIKVLDANAKIESDNVVYTIKEQEIEHRTIKLIKYDIDIEKCIFCGLCDKFCPTNAITVERRKSFDIDLNKCVGCNACANVCPKKIITVNNDLGELPFNKSISVDNDVCVKCLVCVEECPINIIKEITEGVEIDKSNCMYCGKCEGACPVHAIEIKNNKE